MSSGTVSGSRGARELSLLIGNDSEFNCVVLHAEKGDGESARRILDALRDYLPQKGIRVSLLSDLNILNGHYMERFEELAGDCVLGVLILDRLGPDELYQFGYLRGRGKFVITFGDPEGAKHESGHGAGEPGRGRAQAHLDKFAQSGVTGSPETDSGAVARSGESPSEQIRNKIDEALPGIIDRYMEDCLRPAGSAGDGDLRETALRISRHFASRTGFGFPDLDKLYGRLREWEAVSGRTVPSRILSCLASLYAGLIAAGDGAVLSGEYAGRCASIYESILEREKPGALAAVTSKKLADLLVRNSDSRDDTEGLLRAADLYRTALGHFTRDRYPHEFAAVGNNLGVALNALCLMTGETGYARDAAESLRQCLSSGGFAYSPSDRALANSNLGDACVSLAQKSVDPREYERALAAYKEALSSHTGRGGDAETAGLNIRIGNVYKALGDIEAESNNPDRAIEYYDEALLYYPEEIARKEHSANGRKLGEVFERLYREGGDALDLKRAIAAYSASIYAAAAGGEGGCEERALTLAGLYASLARSLEGSGDYEGAAEALRGPLGLYDALGRPREYAEAHVRLGDFYRGLPEKSGRAASAELAVDSYREALGFYTEEEQPEKRREICGLLGGLLKELAEEWTGNVSNKIGYYQEALGYYSEAHFPYEHALLHASLGSAYARLGGAEDPVQNSLKALDSYGRALAVLSPAGYPRECAGVRLETGKLRAALCLITGERGQMELAVRDFEEALAVNTAGEFAPEREETAKRLEEARAFLSGGNGAGGGVESEAEKERPVLKIVKEDEHEGAEAAGPASGDEDEIITLADEVEFDDPEEAAAHYEEVLKRASREESPAGYASLKLRLGRAYGEIGSARGAANILRNALRAYEEALAYYTSENFPVEFVQAQRGAASAWEKLAEQTGDVKGYERAAASYSEALGVMAGESAPVERAAVKESLGDIRRTLAHIKGDAAEYRKALSEYTEALEVFAAGEHPAEYGRIQKNMGFIYGVLAEVDDRSEDYTRAVEAFEKALAAYGAGITPSDHAEIHKYMGIAWGNIAQRDGVPECFGRALEAYRKALSVVTFETSPKDYGLIMRNAASAWESLSGFSDSAEDLKSAAESYEEALRYYTRERMPAEYASVLSALCAIYRRLAEREDAAGNCRKAVGCCERLLGVYNLKEYPLEYAATQNNLGIVYRTLAEREEKGKNCKRAVNSYREALRVYNEKERPVQYGSTKNNLGTAYMTLADVEDKEANCRLARSAFEEALKVRTIQNYPMQFAATQNNLGVVHRMLSEVEDRAKNCRRAINAYETALIIYTIGRFPLEYATTQNNIGGAYTALAEEEDRVRNCDKASEAYQEALKVFTKNTHPAQHEIVKANLELLCEFSGQRASSAAP